MVQIHPSPPYIYKRKDYILYIKKPPLIDNRSFHDPLNFFAGEDYNPANIHQIDKEFFDKIFPQQGTILIPTKIREKITYIPKSITYEYFNCLVCPVTFNGQSTRTNERISCGVECPWWIHTTAGKDILFSTNHVELNKGKFGIKITRTNASHLFHSRLDWIMRHTRETETLLHHRDNDHYNDQPQNIASIMSFEHSEITGKVRAILSRLLNLNERLLWVRPESSEFQQKIQELQKIKIELDVWLNKRDSTDQFWETVAKIDLYRRTLPVKL